MLTVVKSVAVPSVVAYGRPESQWYIGIAARLPANDFRPGTGDGVRVCPDK
jgi:hypothetical protein